MARQKGWGNNAPDLDKIWKEKRFDIYDNELYRDEKVVESPVNQTTLTDRYTAETVKFIGANKATPFFLYFANAMPHVPLFVSDERYDSDPKLAYKLTIEHIDWSVGQMLDTLEAQGIADNTLIIYTSDSGPWLSKNHHGGCALPLRAGKGTTYEGGMREPTVMRWPARIKPGQTCAQVAATLDLLPTFAAIVDAELDADRPIDGLDISRLLVIIEQNTFLPVRFLDYLVLGAEVIDCLLLFPVDPASENHEEELPGLKDEAHGVPDGVIHEA